MGKNGCCGLSLCIIFFLFFLSFSSIANSAVWAKPGCHVVGHTRKIRIPNCVEFQMTTNACRGFCESWAVPTTLEALLVNPNQPITSVAQCCNMMETEDIQVSVLCLGGIKELTFKSAKSCSCFHCKKD
ncbi:thyrostimulin alpha-2 subunit [Cephus cinctus]|uniref:Thyrostimulin alpha-2 subunit n=1 Tax=Cephus cinctus TaxID=211228 RepID=A0AAJ7FU61_CEPCN|nr:thyrostimulin alpha-2 subunit [Cephus cinctus]